MWNNAYSSKCNALSLRLSSISSIFIGNTFLEVAQASSFPWALRFPHVDFCRKMVQSILQALPGSLPIGKIRQIHASASAKNQPCSQEAAGTFGARRRQSSRVWLHQSECYKSVMRKIDLPSGRPETGDWSCSNRVLHIVKVGRYREIGACQNQHPAAKLGGKNTFQAKVSWQFRVGESG